MAWSPRRGGVGMTSYSRGRNASSRTAQMISSDPPFPPAASWCARTTVASRREPVSSTSMASSLNTFSQTPRLAHRKNRLYTVFQGPNRSGRSRHGTPVLTLQMTALMKSRSPRFERGPGWTGSKGRMRFQSASLSSCRCTGSVDHNEHLAANSIWNPRLQPRFRQPVQESDLAFEDTP